MAISSVEMVRGLLVDVRTRLAVFGCLSELPSDASGDPSHRGENREMSGLNVMRQAQMMEVFTSARFQYEISTMS